MTMLPRRRIGWCVFLGLCLLAISAAAWSPADPAQGSRRLLVTSSLGATSAILFVLDEDSAILSAYEAIPGKEESGGLRLLGARKIEQDLLLTRYHDLSEYSYTQLKESYEKSGVGEDK